LTLCHLNEFVDDDDDDDDAVLSTTQLWHALMCNFCAPPYAEQTGRFPRKTEKALIRH